MNYHKLLWALIGLSLLYAFSGSSSIPILRSCYNICCLTLSIYFFHQSSPKPYCPRNIIYQVSLSLGIIGSILTSFRNYDVIPNYEMIVFSMMQACFILSIKHEKKYLFLGRKKPLFIGIVIIFFALLLFSKFLLPYIKNTSFPISVFFVFVLGFSFLVAINRRMNDTDYILILAGVCCMVISSTVASIGQFIYDFRYYELIEDLSFEVGIFCNTVGMTMSNVDCNKSKIVKEY